MKKSTPRKSENSFKVAKKRGIMYSTKDWLIFKLINDTISITEAMYEVVIYVGLLSGYSPGQTKEYNENLSQDSQ
jgi:hypothetical protein